MNKHVQRTIPAMATTEALLSARPVLVAAAAAAATAAAEIGLTVGCTRNPLLDTS
jgi:hypothetical protein